MGLIVYDGLFAIILAQSIHGAPGSQTTRHMTTKQHIWLNFDNKTYDTDTSQQ